MRGSCRVRPYTISYIEMGQIGTTVTTLILISPLFDTWNSDFDFDDIDFPF